MHEMRGIKEKGFQPKEADKNIQRGMKE